MKRIDSAGHQVLCPLYATAAPAPPTPRRGIRVRPMKARKFVVLPSADAGGRKYSLIRRARWNQRVKGPSAPGAPDSGCRCHIISAARKQALDDALAIIAREEERSSLLSKWFHRSVRRRISDALVQARPHP